MSIYSDYAHGYMTEEEFKSACAYENAKERYYEELELHKYDECEEYEDDER